MKEQDKNTSLFIFMSLKLKIHCVLCYSVSNYNDILMVMEESETGLSFFSSHFSVLKYSKRDIF